MFEPAMYGRWKYKIRSAKLFDAAQPLEFWGIHQLDFERAHFDIAMDGISD